MSPVYLFAFSTSTRSEKEPNDETIGMKIYYIFIPIVSHKDSFCHGGRSKLGIGLFIHELLREPLIKPPGQEVANLIQPTIEFPT